MEGSETVVADQCQYGAADFRGEPVKKPTRLVTNAPKVAEELCRGHAVVVVAYAPWGSGAMCSAAAGGPGMRPYILSSCVKRSSEDSGIR